MNHKLSRNFIVYSESQAVMIWRDEGFVPERAKLFEIVKLMSEIESWEVIQCRLFSRICFCWTQHPGVEHIATCGGSRLLFAMTCLLVTVR